MNFHPRTLVSDWYLYDIYDTIPRSLEGAKDWFKNFIPSEDDRGTYICTMEVCYSMCTDPLRRHDGQAMLNSLRKYREDTCQAYGRSSWSFWRPRTWFKDSITYRLKAIDQSITIVDGICKRYLIHG